MKKTVLALVISSSLSLQAEQDCYERSTKHARRYALRGDADVENKGYAQKQVCKPEKKSAVWKSDAPEERQYRAQKQQREERKDKAEKTKKKMFTQ